MQALFHSIHFVIVLAGLCSVAMLLSLIRRASKWGMSWKSIISPDGFSKWMWFVYGLTAVIAIPIFADLRSALGADPRNPLIPGLIVFMFLMLVLYVAHWIQQDVKDREAFYSIPCRTNQICWIGGWGKWAFHDGSHPVEDPNRHHSFWPKHVVSAYKALPVDGEKGDDEQVLRGYLIMKGRPTCSPRHFVKEAALAIVLLKKTLTLFVDYRSFDESLFKDFGKLRDRGIDITLSTVDVVPAPIRPDPIRVFRNEKSAA